MSQLHTLTTVDRRHFLDPERHEAFVAAVRNGFVEDGFILVTGFEGELEDIYDTYATARDTVFAFPDNVLRKYAHPEMGHQRGFNPFQTEHAMDQPKELADLKRFWMTRHEEWPAEPGDNPFGPNIWPEEVPSFRQHALILMNLLVDTGRILLGALDESYGFADGRLEEMTGGAETMLRSLHYPTVDEHHAKAGAVRSAGHTDINLITVMKAVAGLQLCLDDEWLDVESPPDTVIADIGDMLPVIEGITDMQPMKHRVVNPREGDASERFSDPCFIHARRSVMLNPQLRAGDWLDQRLREIGVL